MVRGILINEKDNVLVVIEETHANDEVAYSDEDGNQDVVIAKENIPMFHKMAIKEIPKGSNVIKYGEHMGMASQDIEAGQHVHTHNVESIREDLKEEE
ncbi:UxaA family hydrolase [Enterococcus hirae]|nr:UxaA family hydrolase [Enterococcus hirae]